MTTPPPKIPNAVQTSDAIKRMGLYHQPERVLHDLRAAGIEIGSGLGGPARYLAEQTFTNAALGDGRARHSS